MRRPLKRRYSNVPFLQKSATGIKIAHKAAQTSSTPSQPGTPAPTNAATERAKTSTPATPANHQPIEPVLQRIADERNLKLVKVNIDENQDLAMQYGIQSIPNTMLFEGGAPKASAVGAMPKGMLERQLGFES